MTKKQMDALAKDLVATRRDRIAVQEVLERHLGKPVKAPKKESQSRSARWSRAASAAVAALDDLKSIQGEFEDWKSNLPENLESSALGEKLESITSIDLDSAVDAANEAEGAELPLGFGRD